MRREDFTRFHERVAKLYQRLTGEAVFDTMEAWFELRLVGDGRGHVEVHGRLEDDSPYGNVLQFRFDLDQTFLPLLAEQLRIVTIAFPVVGSPQD